MTSRFLVLGSGGREHALVRALAQPQFENSVFAIPGNPGIAKIAECHLLDLTDHAKIIHFCKEHKIDCVLVGPEGPLVAGICDELRAHQIACVGPSQLAAQLEGSKIFSKKFMQKYHIPTAASQVVTSKIETMTAAKKFKPPFVLKADGLAAGKGVVICKDLVELEQTCHDFFEKKILGNAGMTALLEEFTTGWELSYLILTEGENFQALPLAQDHKRLSDHDAGPNTGGMGTIAPLKIDAELEQRIQKEIILPTLAGIKNEKWIYRGIIFIGIMVSPTGPMTLEYNVRFGDPETQVILPLYDGDWGKIFIDLAQGKLTEMKFNEKSCCCVVLAAEGYPDQPIKSAAISGDAFSETEQTYFIHAGTKLENQQLVTAGGRVLNSIGLANTKPAAIKNAYTQAEKAKWTGQQKRSDIGSKQI